VRRLQRELEVLQIELEKQNEEMRAAGAEIANGLKQYTELYDFAPTGYFSLTANGTIRLVNLSGARLMGRERSQLLGRRFETQVVADNRKLFSAFLKQVFTTENNTSCEVGLLPNDRGTYFVHLEARLAPDGKMILLSMVDITERQRSAKALRDSEAIFFQTFHASPVAMALSSIGDGRLLDVNAEFLRLTGWSRDEVIGHTKRALKIWKSATDRDALVADIKAHQIVKNRNVQIYSKTGQVFNLLWSAQKVMINDKEYLLSASLDVTAQKATETALVESQETLVNLINALPDNVIFKDGAGRWLVANPPATDFFRLKNIPWIGKTDAELARDRPDLKELFTACIRSDAVGWAAGKITCVTERGPGPDGQMEEHEVHKVPLFNADGSRHALLVIGRNVTVKARLESALKLSELMASQSRDALLLVRNRDGRIFSANAAAVEFYGYTREELLAKTIYDLRQSNAAAMAAQQLSAAFASGILFETLHVHKNGHTLPVEVSSNGASFEGEGFLVSSIRDISARKEAETKLLQLEQSMAVAANSIILVDVSGIIFWVNEGFTHLTGYTREEAIGKNARLLKSGQQNNEFYRTLWRTIRAGKVWQGELINRRKDGTLYHQGTTITPVFDATGQKLTHYIGVQEDITARKQTEAALEQSHSLLRATLESTADGILVVDATGKTSGFNRKFLELWRIPPALAENHNDGQMLDFVQAQFAEPEKFKARVQEIYAEPQATSFEELAFQDGRVFERYSQPQLIGDTVLGRVWSFRDITTRKEASQRLAVSEQKYRQLFESIADGIVSVDMAGMIKEFNPAYAQMLGYPAAELLRRTYVDLTPEKWHAFEAVIVREQVLPRGFSEVYEKEYRRHDGSVFPVELRSFAIREADGQITGMWATVRDITSRKQALESLRLNEARLRTWFEMPLAGIAITSPGKGWLQVNDRLCEMLGYTREELYSKTWAELTHPDDLPENEAHFARLLRGESDGYAMEKRFLPKNGGFLQTELTVRCARLADGKPDYIVALIQDITTRKQAEINLLSAQKTASQKSALLKSVLESPQNVVIFSLDANYCYTEFTQSHSVTIKQIWGKDIGVGMNLLDIISDPADRAKAKRNFDRVLQGESFLLVEEYGDATWLRTYYENRYSPIFANNGKVAGLTVFVIDITARKKAEDELIQARDFHLQLLQKAPVLIWRAGPDTKCNWFNTSWLKFTGRTLEQEAGDGWAAGVHPDDLEECVKRYLAHFEKRESFLLQYRLRRHDGEYRWIADHGQPYEQMGGGFGGYIGYCHDIHETILAKDLLEQRVVERTKEIATLSEVIDNTTVAFIVADMQGILLTVNRAFEKLVGHARGELLSGKFSCIDNLTPPEWHEMQRAKNREATRSRQPVRYEKEYFRNDGSRLPVELFVQPVFDAEGNFQQLRTFVTDITERKRQAAKLAADAHEIQQLYHRAPCGYHSLNKNGDFVRINDTELGWLGYTRDELLGRNMTELLTPAYQEFFKKEFIGFTNADRNGDFDIELIRKDGTILSVVMNTIAVRDADGNFIESRTTVFDNTERKKAAHSLEMAWKLANEASRAKSEFLANMSHEIRTPLNAILGFTHLLREDATVPASARDKLKTIGKSGDNLMAILNDILDLAKIEAGRMAIQPVEFPCAAMLEEIVQLFHLPAEAKELSLVLVKLSEIPHLVRADGEKIRRVLSNLLGNAIKFTRSGGIEVEATTARSGDGQPWRLRVAVKDTGPGIPPEEISRLFNKFEQTSAGRASQTGTGLGLAISQQYARLLGGYITVESQVGKGSTFTFEVPLEPVFETEQIQRKIQSSARRLAPGVPECRVLVVDDLEENRRFLLELLLLSGFVSRAVASGAEALTVAAEWRPQLVLMDTRMPEMDGLETIRRLRAGPENSALKIISLSAMAYEEDQAAALKAGADDFVAKPVPVPELLEKIGQLLKLAYVPLVPELAPAVAGRIPSRAETATALARLSESWRNQLHDDLVLADFNRVEEMIKSLQPPHAKLAEALRQLTSQFDAESLLNLLAEATAIASIHHD